MRRIAAHFKGISETGLRRHAPHAIKNAAVSLRHEEKRENEADELRRDASRIRQEMWELLEIVKKEQDNQLRLACLEKLQNRVIGWMKVVIEAKLAAPKTIADDAEWIKLRTKILTVLDKYPAAKRELTRVLTEERA